MGEQGHEEDSMERGFSMCGEKAWDDGCPNRELALGLARWKSTLPTLINGPSLTDRKSVV